MRALVALAAAATLVGGCSSDSSGTAASTAAAQTSSTPSAVQFGDAISITRTDTGGAVGIITFLEAGELPARCKIGTRPGVVMAIRVAIDTGTSDQLPVPDSHAIKYVDTAGATRDVEPTSIYDECAAEYPEAVDAPVGGKTDGWIAFRLQSEAAELLYSPYASDDSAFLPLSPSTVRIRMPAPSASASPDTPAAPSAGEQPAPAPVTTVPSPVVPSSTQQAGPVAPPTGLDSEGRPAGSGGSLVECAGADYQPGTGIFADGSKGFAPECLPGGSMR
ncbi:hypothetical protein [Nocardia farcinica]